MARENDAMPILGAVGITEVEFLPTYHQLLSSGMALQKSAARLAGAG